MTGFSSIDTYGSLIDEVTVSLQGFGVEVDQIATLTQEITPASTQLRLDMPDAIARGLVEIDDELIFISSAMNGVATVQPWGRGFKGTTAASHSAGSAVYISPTFPRSIVAREINNTIRSVYPRLFAVYTHDFTCDALRSNYEMPAAMDRILSVEWRWLAIDGWNPLNEWELVSSAYTSDYATGKYLALGAPLGTGIKVHVTYAAPPTLLDSQSDAFTLTGLPASCRDVILYGAASRLVSWLDVGRLPVETVSSDQQDQVKPIGGAVAISREFRNLYNMRLEQERTALHNRYPVRAHRVR